MMTYKGYVGSVTYDDDGLLFGTVICIDDVVAFEGSSVDEIRQAFRGSVDEYLDFRASLGDTPERPRPVGLTPEQQEELDALAALPDEDIDFSDMPEVTDWTGAKRGMFYRPAKEQVSASNGMLTYKGLTAALEVDYGAGLLPGHVQDVEDVVT